MAYLTYFVRLPGVKLEPKFTFVRFNFCKFIKFLYVYKLDRTSAYGIFCNVKIQYENCNNKKSENLNHCKNQWIKTQEFCENKLMNKIRNLPYKDIVLFYLFCFMIIVSCQQ